MVEISVVVPVYKSEECLEELHRQVADALAGVSYELILVDDESPDNSWGVIRRICAGNPSVVGIRLRKNSGQDNAILCGLRQAKGRFAAIMDDDLQHSPYDIPALRRACLDRSWDVCYAHFAVMRHAWWKRLGSWLNGKLAQLVIHKPKGLYLSPFKVVRREIVDEVVKYIGAYPYVDGLILNVTHTVGQIEAAHNERYKGRGNFGLARSLLIFMRVVTGFSVWPLRFSACFGLVLASCGFGLALFYVAQHFWGDHQVEGWATIVVLQLLIGGTLLVSIGLVGEYLGRLYLNCNGKPQATVRERCNG